MTQKTEVTQDETTRLLLEDAHDLTLFIKECEIWFPSRSRHPLAVQARNLRKRLEALGIDGDTTR
jgi:hypothetical protein